MRDLRKIVDQASTEKLTEEDRAPSRPFTVALEDRPRRHQHRPRGEHDHARHAVFERRMRQQRRAGTKIRIPTLRQRNLLLRF